MKLRFVLAIVMSCALVGAAQEMVSEPDFADVFFRLDANKLIPLERQIATIQGKASGFIVMSMKASSEFPGAKSQIRIPAGQPLEFVVMSAFSPSSVDPNTLYVLRKLNAKKKTRELIIMSGHASPIGASTESDLAEGSSACYVCPIWRFIPIKMTTGLLFQPGIMPSVCATHTPYSALE